MTFLALPTVAIRRGDRTDRFTEHIGTARKPGYSPMRLLVYISADHCLDDRTKGGKVKGQKTEG